MRITQQRESLPGTNRNEEASRTNGVGLGFGNVYEEFPGGVDGFCYFLSVGNQEWETGRQVAEQAKPYMNQSTYDDFARGERYLSPAVTGRWARCVRVPTSSAPS